MALPSIPGAGLLGLEPLPAGYYGLLAAIVAGYALSAELAKRFFYRRAASAIQPSRGGDGGAA
jgi:Mg2+-importing ATPase